MNRHTAYFLILLGLAFEKYIEQLNDIFTSMLVVILLFMHMFVGDGGFIIWIVL